MVIGDYLQTHQKTPKPKQNTQTQQLQLNTQELWKS